MCTLQQISKNRTALMGFAIIWVMLFHFFSDNYFYGLVPLKYFSCIGYGGVDIFFMLSGFGLVSGFDKYRTTLQFLVRRFIRIYPSYLLVLFVKLYLINKEPITDVLIASTGIGFFLPFWKIRWYEWYVPTLFLFYFIFPMIMSFLKKYGKKSLLWWAMLGCLCTLVLVFVQKGTVILATCRFPIFILGIYFGCLNRDGKDITIKPLLLIIASIFFLVIQVIMLHTLDPIFMWRSALNWALFLFIVPGLCFLLCHFLDLMLWVKYLLSFFGTMSLELYLIHISFGGYSITPFIKMVEEGHISANVLSSYLVFTVYLFSCVAVAFALHFVAYRIDNYFKKLLIKNELTTPMA